jgi:hypothetical protein
VITRSVNRNGRSSKSGLSLSIAGEDLTQQEQRLTEQLLQARFSSSLLPKTLVFTQEDLLALLQVRRCCCCMVSCLKSHQTPALYWHKVGLHMVYVTAAPGAGLRCRRSNCCQGLTSLLLLLLLLLCMA